MTEPIVIDELVDTIEDRDLDTSYHGTWVYHCEACGAMFQSKPISGRTLFPFFGYHPTDGNYMLFRTPDGEPHSRATFLSENAAYKCDRECSNEHFKSLRTLNAFKQALTRLVDRLNKEQATCLSQS